MAPVAAILLARQLVESGTRIDDRLVRVDWSCREIAGRLARSPGTISKHLGRLGRLGVRVSVTPLVFDVEVLERAASGAPVSTREQHEPGQDCPVGEGSGGTDDVAVLAVEVIERLAELAAAVPDAQDTIRAAIEAVSAVVSDRAPRDDRATLRDEKPARDNRAVARSSSSLSNEVGRKDLPTCRARDTKTARALIAPILERASRQNKLATITNPAGLIAALAAYTDEQVTRAVQGFVAESWGDLDQPLAVFVRRAQIGHPDLFAPEPLTQTQPDLSDVTPASVRPSLETDAQHLIDSDGFDPQGQQLGRQGLARIRAGLRAQRTGRQLSP